MPSDRRGDMLLGRQAGLLGAALDHLTHRCSCKSLLGPMMAHMMPACTSMRTHPLPAPTVAPC